MMATEFEIVILFILSAVASSRDPTPITRVGKLIVDTDAGGDDAVALIMAAESEKLNEGPKLIAITCVNGNADVDRVAVNVLKTLKIVQRLDIPVYKGASHPVMLPVTYDYYYGKDGFGDFHYPEPPSTTLIQTKHAVIAMIDLVKEYPGEVTLLALGPLTNIALAIRMYPEFLEKLQQLIVMGGSTEGRGNMKPSIEFNFFADPSANHIVLSSASKPITLVPLETTKRARVDTEFKMSLNQTNNMKFWLIHQAGNSISKPVTPLWNSPDAVAAAVALTSGSVITRMEACYSEAVYEGVKTAGMILVDYTNITDNVANINLVQDIDTGALKQLYSNYLK
ncbi:pyrimidine-specific ribonucleoside hydrolase RihA-like isoform X2 [Athalia rosae]|uniref:pyrimidine-specific ribonucleoside hydrolase RihA-like isoform X2 n=1 Tax=Athalia rosae TaxID=37344 RepID=UPI0006265E28|nr:pyrimidine-specific ribonucleoside hydrolase RihA-like isoform X2 [Athalia rosae]